MDFNYIVVPAIVVLVLVLVACGALRRIITLQRGEHFRARRWKEGIILWPVAFFCIAVAALAAFNAIALYYYRHPPPGNLYSVNRRLMRLQCMGQGSPTIVLDAGGGNDGLTWAGIQPKLALHTQVCSYDRAGMGWSDPGPSPRDADHVAAELHGLLASAHIQTPVVLMGHSMGGLFIRAYARHYPVEVAGLVFEDSSTPLQNRQPAYRAFDEPRKGTRFDHLFDEVTLILGVPRLLGACSGEFDRVKGINQRVFYEDRCHEPFQAINAEGEAFDLSGQETVNTGPFGDVPILVLSHDMTMDASHGLPQSLIDESEANQNAFLRLSTHSRRVIVKDSGHFVHIDRPDVVEREVADLLDRIRGNKPDLQPRQTVVAE
jgi:pimeloyl-ACP methyl ester carboxylesterase